MDSAGWRRTAAAALGVVAAAAAAAGCGAGGSGHTNEPRPPVPIVVTASISNDRVSVSPRMFGAGPISLVVTNQTRASQQVTLARNGKIRHHQAGRRQVRNLSVRRIAPHHDAGGRGNP